MDKPHLFLMINTASEWAEIALFASIILAACGIIIFIALIIALYYVCKSLLTWDYRHINEEHWIVNHNQNKGEKNG